MKLKLIKIWNITKIVGLVIVIFGSIGLVEKQYGERICTSINVEIDNQFENYFINESDIVELITDGGDNRIVGASFDDLNLKTIEDELNTELEYLEIFDQARINIRKIVDMPDRKLDLFIKLCLQNRGKFPKRKHNLFSMLAPEEISKLAKIVENILKDYKIPHH